MDNDRPLSGKARRKIKAELQLKAREQHVGLFQKRMELARAGAMFFKDAKYAEALQSYHRYLDLLEKTKGAKPGGLNLGQFDQKKDIAELLLLTGVYWDLAKMHDRVSDKDLARLHTYLEQFVVFSKGLPYQRVSAELVRKFLVNGTPRHRKVFKDIHIRLGGGKCFIATAVEDYCEVQTLPSLRQFRDQSLLTRKSGRIFVGVYYAVGPTLARGVLRLPESFQKSLAKTLDRVAQALV